MPVLARSLRDALWMESACMHRMVTAARGQQQGQMAYHERAMVPVVRPIATMCAETMPARIERNENRRDRNAAFFGIVMNTNYLLAGTVSSNPILIILGTLVVLAWRNAGWIGLDRWLLPALGTPWQPGEVFDRSTDATS